LTQVQLPASSHLVSLASGALESGMSIGPMLPPLLDEEPPKLELLPPLPLPEPGRFVDPGSGVALHAATIPNQATRLANVTRLANPKESEDFVR
jgi:hypothetical protein